MHPSPVRAPLAPPPLLRLAAAGLLTLLVAVGLPLPAAAAAGSATLSGVVTSPDGQPLPAGTVVTARPDGDGTVVTAPVDGAGGYSLTIPADTTVRVTAAPTASAVLADSAEEHVHVGAGGAAARDLALRVPTLTGVVVDPADAPVAGALVEQNGPTYVAPTTSKADGTWATAAASGTYSLAAQPPAGSDLRPSTWTQQAVPGQGMALRLRAAANVVGDVRLPDGAAAGHAFVTAQSTSGVYLDHTEGSTSTDALGRFGLRLPAGGWRLTARPPYAETELVHATTSVSLVEAATATVDMTFERGNVLGVVHNPDGTTYTGSGWVELLDASFDSGPPAELRQGTFALKLAAGQTARLVVRPQGDAGVVASAPVEVTAPADGGAALRPVVALQRPNVSGVVRGLDGAPSAHTSVQVVLPDGTHAHALTTDAQGRYGTRLPAGEYELRAQPGWDAPVEVAPGSATLTVGTSDVVLDLALRQANLLGRVLDPTGTPVAGANVQVTDPHGAHVDAWSTTRSDGRWGLLLPEGTWTLTARAPHGSDEVWVAGSRSVVAGAEQTTGIDLSLRAPNVVGRVLDPSGTPVAGAQVYVTDALGYHVPDAHASTGASGRFGLLLPPGDYVLRAQPPYGDSALAAGSASLVVGDSPVTQDVSLRRPNVAGTVLSPTSEPLRYSYVEVFDVTRNTYLPGAFAAEGRYTLFLEPGAYRLTARPPYGSSGLVATTVEVTVVKDAAPLVRDIRLGQPNVTGVVRDRDGAPVRGSVVDVVDSRGRYVPGAWAVTGSDGTYALLLPEGSYDLTARPAWDDRVGHVATTVRGVAVTADTAVVRDLTLGTPNVTGTVVTPDGAPHRDAWIDVRTADGQHVPGLHAYTGATGRFAVALPEDGRAYVLTARPSWSSTGLVAGSTTVTAVPGSTLDTQIALGRPNVTGVVTGADGRAVRGSFVDAVDTATGRVAEGAWAVTGPDGAYSLSLPAGDYRLTARPAWDQAAGTVPTTVDVTVAEGTTASASIRLAAANVTGQVTGDGAGMAYLLVRATSGGNDVAHTWTDRSGAFALGLAPGTYELVVEPPHDDQSGWSRTSRSLTVADAPLTADVALARGNVTGTVTDAAGTTPIANAFVHVYESGALRSDLGVVTAPDGTFTLTLPTSGGPWELKAQPSYDLASRTAARSSLPQAVVPPASAVELRLQ